MAELIRNLFENATIQQNTLPNGPADASGLTEGILKCRFDLGSWETRQWNFDGLSVKYFDVAGKSPFAVAHQQSMDIVHLHFNLSGNMHIHDKRYHSFRYGAMQHNMSYLKGFDAVVSYEEGSNRALFVQIPKSLFLSLIDNTSDPLMRFGARLIEGAPAFVSDQNSLISNSIYVILYSLLNCRYTGGVKKIFLLSKCIELLALQAEQFESRQTAKYVFCKTESDRDRIQFARQYVLEHYATPPSLAELAKLVGINEFKLKNGFRELFNTTVFEYLTDYKLSVAKADLQSGAKTPSELALDLGYSSLQHFSNAFKKKFGQSPRFYRRP